MAKSFKEYINESKIERADNFTDAENKLKNADGIVVSDVIGDIADVEKQIGHLPYDKAVVLNTKTDGDVSSWTSDVFLVGSPKEEGQTTIKDYFKGNNEGGTISFKEFHEMMTYHNEMANRSFKLFVDYKNDNAPSNFDYLTEQENVQVDEFVKMFEDQYGNDLSKIEEAFGTIVGGVTGFLIGPTIGKIIAHTLGVERGILYDMFTSRLVSTALGSAIAKAIQEKKR